MKKSMIALFFCIAAIRAASAHAFLDHAEPKVGSVVQVSPSEVKVWFTEGLILPFSDLKVLDASGKEYEKGDKHLDPGNGSLLIVSVQRLKPGRYTVSWRATAVDTHVTKGTFSFQVAP